MLSSHPASTSRTDILVKIKTSHKYLLRRRNLFNRPLLHTNCISKKKTTIRTLIRIDRDDFIRFWHLSCSTMMTYYSTMFSRGNIISSTVSFKPLSRRWCMRILILSKFVLKLIESFFKFFDFLFLFFDKLYCFNWLVLHPIHLELYG
jgi:hypothetical protein